MFEKMRERREERNKKPDYALETKELFGDAVRFRSIEDVETEKEYPILAVQDKYVYCKQVYDGEYNGIQFEYMDYACLYDKPGMIRNREWNYQVDYLILHNVTTRQRICFAGWKYENYKKMGWIKNDRISGKKVWSEQFPLTQTERDKLYYYDRWAAKYCWDSLYVMYYDTENLHIVFYQSNPGDPTCSSIPQEITIIKSALDNLHLY